MLINIRIGYSLTKCTFKLNLLRKKELRRTISVDFDPVVASTWIMIFCWKFILQGVSH